MAYAALGERVQEDVVIDHGALLVVLENQIAIRVNRVNIRRNDEKIKRRQ